MSLTSDAKRELRANLAALSDQAISTADLSNMRECVKADQEAREIYVEHLFLEALLHWSIDRESGETADRAKPLPPHDPATKPLPIISSIANLPTSLLQILQFHVSGRMIGLAASILLIGYFAAVSSLLLWDYLRQANRSTQSARSAELPLVTLKRADTCRWRTPTPPRSGEALHDRKLQLDEGLAELEFAGGVTVLIQGPAEVQLQSPTCCYLQRGKLLARVPSGAVGFTVETPQATIVDLGTEFGVETQTGDDVQVYVFRGRVEVEGKALPARAGTDGKRVRLETGQKVSVQSGVVTSVVSERTVPAPFVPLHAAQSPVAGIRPYSDDPNTLHLWHFDDDSVVDFARTNPHTKPLPLVLAGDGVTTVTLATLGLSGFGKGLQLPGPRDRVRGAYNATPQWEPPNHTQDNISTATFWNQWADDNTLGAFTYEALAEVDFNCRVESGAYDLCTLESDAGDGGTPAFQIYVVAGTGNGLGTLHFLNATARQDLSAPLPGKFDGDAPIEGGWYHVAITYSGDETDTDNLKFYWTRVNPQTGEPPTAVRLIGTASMRGDLVTPLADFAIGNLAARPRSARAMGGNDR